MAVSKTLTSRFEELITSMMDMDRLQIRAALVKLVRQLKAVENGSAARKAKSKIARLETALETSEADREEANAALKQSNAEIGNLQIELQTMQAEIAKYQQERAKQKEREQIPEIQFQILSLLPSEHSGEWMGIGEIARAVNIPVDVAEIHADKLRDAQLVISRYNAYDAVVWHRTMEGNKLVHAKSLAGEQEEKKKRYKYADLPDVEEQALVMLSEGEMTEREIARLLDQKMRLVRHHLHSLREAEMATDAEEHPGNTFSATNDAEEEETYSPLWRILRDGEAYLAEREPV